VSPWRTTARDHRSQRPWGRLRFRAPPSPRPGRTYPGEILGTPRIRARHNRNREIWPTAARSPGAGCLSKRITVRARDRPPLLRGTASPGCWLCRRTSEATTASRSSVLAWVTSGRTSDPAHGTDVPGPVRSGSTRPCPSTPEVRAREQPRTRVASGWSAPRCDPLADHPRHGSKAGSGNGEPAFVGSRELPGARARAQLAKLSC
jgi:hypothetical protein